MNTPQSPTERVAQLQQRARRGETPCESGSLIWRAWGEGRPLVLFHGSHGSWLHWIRNIDGLAARHTVWAVDLPGFGDSALPSQQSHAALAGVLADGLRCLLGSQLPVQVAGFSFGGLIAAYLAALHPELVRQVIIVDSGGLDTPRGRFELQRLRGLEGEARRAAARANLLAIMLHAEASADELALHVAATSARKTRLLSIAPLVLPDKLLPALGRLACPFAAIWGEFDQLHPTPAVQEAALRRVRPDTQFRVIPDAGHWSMYERPEAFNRALLELLSTA